MAIIIATAIWRVRLFSALMVKQTVKNLVLYSPLCLKKRTNMLIYRRTFANGFVIIISFTKGVNFFQTRLSTVKKIRSQKIAFTHLFNYI